MSGGLIEIGALWLSSGDQKSIATGSMGKGGARLVLVENDKRGNESAPDWRLCVAPSKREEAQRVEPEDEMQVAPVLPEEKPFNYDDDDLPF